MKHNLSASLLCDTLLPWDDDCRGGECTGGHNPNSADNIPTRVVILKFGCKIYENIKSIRYMLCVVLNQDLSLTKILHKIRYMDYIVKWSKKHTAAYMKPRTLMNSNTNTWIIISTTETKMSHVDDLVQDCCNHIADAPELPQSCTKPSMQSPHISLQWLTCRNWLRLTCFHWWRYGR